MSIYVAWYQKKSTQLSGPRAGLVEVAVTTAQICFHWKQGWLSSPWKLIVPSAAEGRGECWRLEVQRDRWTEMKWWNLKGWHADWMQNHLLFDQRSWWLMVTICQYYCHQSFHSAFSLLACSWYCHCQISCFLLDHSSQNSSYFSLARILRTPPGNED